MLKRCGLYMKTNIKWSKNKRWFEQTEIFIVQLDLKTVLYRFKLF